MGRKSAIEGVIDLSDFEEYKPKKAEEIDKATISKSGIHLSRKISNKIGKKYKYCEIKYKLDGKRLIIALLLKKSKTDKSLTLVRTEYNTIRIRCTGLSKKFNIKDVINADKVYWNDRESLILEFSLGG